MTELPPGDLPASDLERGLATAAYSALARGLRPYVRRQFEAKFGGRAFREALSTAEVHEGDAVHKWEDFDAAALLKVMWRSWNQVFGGGLSIADRSLVSILRDFRPRWAHDKPLRKKDIALGVASAQRLLESVASPEAASLDDILGSLTFPGAQRKRSVDLPLAGDPPATGEDRMPTAAPPVPPRVAAGVRHALASAPPGDPTGALSTMTTRDWAAFQVVRSRRHDVARARWSIAYSDPFRFDHATRGERVLLIAMSLALVLAFASPFILGALQHQVVTRMVREGLVVPDPLSYQPEYAQASVLFRDVLGPPLADVGRFIASVLAALCVFHFRPHRRLLSLAIVLLVLVAVFSHLILPTTPTFRIAVTNVIQNGLFIILIALMVLMFPMLRRNQAALAYHSDQVKRFRRQIIELMRGAQDWELRNRLSRRTVEETGREGYTRFVERRVKISTVYDHGNNPARVPSLRKRIVEYATTEMHGEFDFTSRAAAELEGLLKAYGEHDWLCLQAALALGPVDAGVGATAVGVRELESEFGRIVAALEMECRHAPVDRELAGKYERVLAMWRDDTLATLAGSSAGDIEAARATCDHLIERLIERMRQESADANTPGSP